MLSEKDKALGQAAVPVELRDRTLERWQSMPLPVRVPAGDVGGGRGARRRLHLRHRAAAGRHLLLPAHGALPADGSTCFLPAYKGEVRVGIFSYLPAIAICGLTLFMAYMGRSLIFQTWVPVAHTWQLVVAAGHLHPDPRCGAACRRLHLPRHRAGAVALSDLRGLHAGHVLGAAHDARAHHRVQRLLGDAMLGVVTRVVGETIIGFLILAALLVATGAADFFLKLALA
jgi:hypothetical protein